MLVHNKLSKESNLDEALRVARLAISFLFMVFLFKLMVGLFSGSIALIADAFNSLSDTIMILILYLALRIVKKRPDKVFQYGYYRIEDLLSLFMSVMFFFVAGKIMFDGLMAIISDYGGSEHYLVAVVTELIVSIALFLFSFKQYEAAKRANITSLALSARDMRIDTLSAIFVAASIFTNKYFGMPIEGYAAFVIGFLIILNAYRGFKTAMLNLLDVWKSPEIIAKIKSIVNSSKYLRIGEIKLRRMGPIILGEAVIYAPEELRVEDVDEILEEIEKQIYSSIPDLKEMMWEVQPLPEYTELCVVPVRVSDGKEVISEFLEKADKFVVFEIDYNKGEYKRKYEIPNKFSGRGSRSVKIVSAFLEKGIDCVLARKMDYVTFSLLDAYEIEVYAVETSNIAEALEKLLEKKISPTEDYTESSEEVLEEPTQVDVSVETQAQESRLIISKDFLEKNNTSKYFYPMMGMSSYNEGEEKAIGGEESGQTGFSGDNQDLDNETL